MQPGNHLKHDRSPQRQGTADREQDCPHGGAVPRLHPQESPGESKAGHRDLREIPDEPSGEACRLEDLPKDAACLHVVFRHPSTGDSVHSSVPV